MLRNKNGNDQTPINPPGIFTPSYNVVKYGAHSTLCWIMDSGATDHVSHLSPTHNKTKSPHNFIGLPNGEKEVIKNIEGFL